MIKKKWKNLELCSIYLDLGWVPFAKHRLKHLRRCSAYLYSNTHGWVVFRQSWQGEPGVWIYQVRNLLNILGLYFSVHSYHFHS